MISGTQHLERRLGKNRATNRRHLEELEETAPHSKTNELPQGETNDLETTREPDTTSQTGRQINCHKARQMNWRQPKSLTPQPDWETNALLQGETNELETVEDPDTTSLVGSRQAESQPDWETNYGNTPVCAKPSYWMRRDDSEFIHEFTWKWTAYVGQICFGQVSSTDEG